MAPHTPAPWTIGEPIGWSEGSFMIAILAPSGNTIASVYGGDRHAAFKPGIALEEARGNARLIGMAPALLQLVQEAHDYLSDDDSEINVRDWLKVASAAIAAAEAA